MHCICNLTLPKTSYLYYALLPLHPVSAGCGFYNRAYRRIYFKLYPYALFLDTGRDPRHIGNQ